MTRRAFTAIELLVVIAILVMLVGLSVPSVSDSLLRSKVANAANAIQEVHRQARMLARSEDPPVPTSAPSGQAHYGVVITADYAAVTFGQAATTGTILMVDGKPLARIDFAKNVVATDGTSALGAVGWMYQYGTGYPINSTGYAWPPAITDGSVVNVGVGGSAVVTQLEVRTIDGSAKGRHHGAVRIFKAGLCSVELE